MDLDDGQLHVRCGAGTVPGRIRVRAASRHPAGGERVVAFSDGEVAHHRPEDPGPDAAQPLARHLDGVRIRLPRERGEDDAVHSLRPYDGVGGAQRRWRVDHDVVVLLHGLLDQPDGGARVENTAGRAAVEAGSQDFEML